MFTNVNDEIDQAAKKLWTEDPELEEKKWHMDGNVIETVNPAYSGVNIRHFLVPEGQTEVTATRRGLVLKRDEWEKIKTSLKLVEEAAPELESTQPCSETH
uniref:Uncharacterized protein n=1 Tax=Magallana gigas TaxID=29159 RepID=A0A8W8MH36_MAGGI